MAPARAPFYINRVISEAVMLISYYDDMLWHRKELFWGYEKMPARTTITPKCYWKFDICGIIISYQNYYVLQLSIKTKQDCLSTIL